MVPSREWRKLVKKLRRKRIRSKAAQERDAAIEAGVNLKQLCIHIPSQNFVEL